MLDELVGADDIDELLGGDEEDLVGADKRLVRRKPKGWQTQVLGLARTTVAIAGTAQIISNPQRIFRTERFAVAESNAANFEILDLVIGRDSMMVDPNPVPAELFQQTSVGMSLRGYTAGLGNTITVTVRNLDAVNPQVFSGGITGTTAVR